MTTWIITALATLVIVGIVAWFYPVLKSRINSAWRNTCYSAFAKELELEFLQDGSSGVDQGFMPTVVSIFGPYGELRNIIKQESNQETVYLFEYLFGGRPSHWSFKRGVTIIAFHLFKSTPMFTLDVPRSPPKSRKTKHKIQGESLVVQVVGKTIELWSTERDKKRVRKIINTRLLEELKLDPSWNIRGIDDWLVIFNKGKQISRTRNLKHFFYHAKHLRALVKL